MIVNLPGKLVSWPQNRALWRQRESDVQPVLAGSGKAPGAGHFLGCVTFGSLSPRPRHPPLSHHVRYTERFSMYHLGNSVVFYATDMMIGRRDLERCVTSHWNEVDESGCSPSTKCIPLVFSPSPCPLLLADRGL